MRLQIFLDKTTNNPPASWNNYGENARATAAWIYNLLGQSSKEYEQPMHDEGLRVRDSLKVIKPFCYSNIGQTAKGYILNVASPDKKFLKHFLTGIKAVLPPPIVTPEDQNIYIYQSIKKCPAPSIDYRPMTDTYFAKVYALSPVVVRSADAGYHVAGTSTPEDISQSLNKNLFDKYVAIYGVEPDDTKLEIKFAKYIVVNTRLKDERGQYNSIPGHLGQISMSGSFELIMLAFESGLGAKNGMGFGFITELYAGHQSKTVKN